MKKLLMLILFFQTLAQAQSSVLSKGEWIKVSVSKSGVYKIDKAFLEKNAPDFAKTDPNLLKIFTGNPTALPQANNAERIKDLIEIPVHVQDQNAQWDKEDYLAFFAHDPHKIFYKDGQFKHEINPYSDQNFYFITVGDSPSRKLDELSPQNTQAAANSLPFYHYEELEQTNLLNSGRSWFGPYFNSNYSFSPVVADFESDFRLNYEVLPMGRAAQFITTLSGTTEIRRDTLLGSLYNSSDNTARYNRIANAYPVQITAAQPTSTIQLRLSSASIGNVGVYMDYWSVNYKRTLRFNTATQTIYRTPSDQTEGSFRLNNNLENALVWQAKGPFDIKVLTVNSDNHFSVESGSSEVVVFDRNTIPNPVFKEKVSNTSVDGVPEVLVIFPEKFRKEAERLIQLKKENEDFDIQGYSTAEVYNLYSSGKVDPTAIRDFCRDLHTRLPGKLQFLLLLGDASFDFKNNNKATYIDTDLLIPSYQSRESLEPIYSYASDDYFGFLDDNEGEWPEGYSLNNRWVSNRDDNHLMDISVGRIPARSLLELNNYVNKYISYKENSVSSQWQNRFAFVADNRDYNIHKRDSEVIEDMALKSYPGLMTEKLYLDDFPMVNQNGSYTSPEANKKLHNLVNDGTYLITYIGHGAEDGLTNEKLLTLSDILTFSNPDKLPIWFTATCQFGKFDNPGVQSGAELSLLRPNGGAIALLTTTRPVYSSTNQLVNQAFFGNLKTAKTLGELFRITKNQSVQGEINRNFSLLGDPTLTLPNWSDDIALELSSDTLFALGKTTFSGTAASVENGNLLVSVIDKPSSKKTLGSFSDSPVFEYKLNSEQIFLGKFQIKNHRFGGEITLPVQQTQEIGKGRIILTAVTSDSSHLEFGYNSPVIISSQILKPTIDKTPPRLQARLDGLNLIWEISDESGINLSGIDTNRRLTLVVNGENIENMLSYYTSVSGGTSGRIIYPVGALSNTTHSATLIASDIYNNTARQTFDFNIERPTLQIKKSAVFPNPVTDYLNIKISHNRPGDDLNLKFVLYDVIGRVLWEETSECKKCAENVSFNADFANLSLSFPKVFYKVTVKSNSEKQDQQISGSLFFWK
jgi:hypothetical protein